MIWMPLLAILRDPAAGSAFLAAQMTWTTAAVHVIVCRSSGLYQAKDASLRPVTRVIRRLSSRRAASLSTSFSTGN